MFIVEQHPFLPEVWLVMNSRTHEIEVPVKGEDLAHEIANSLNESYDIYIKDVLEEIYNHESTIPEMLTHQLFQDHNFLSMN